MTRFRAASFVFALIVGAVTGTTAALAAEGPGVSRAPGRAEAPGKETTTTAVFLLSGHYQVRVNDEVSKEARCYRAAGGVPRLLVTAAGLPQAAVITAGEKTVSGVDPARIVAAAEDPDSVSVDLASGPAKSLSLTVDGDLLKFAVGSSRVVLEPRPPLVGELKPDEVLAYMPEYRRNAAAYEPGKGDMRLLETLKTETDMEVFFGTWCPHCEELMPRFFRVMQQLKNPNLHVHLHGVPLKVLEDPVARQYKVEGVPTGVLRRGSTILATLAGQNWIRPESALAALLFGEDSFASPPGR